MRVKAKGLKYHVMKSAMRIVIEHLGGIEAVQNKFASLTTKKLLSYLWQIANRNLSLDDNHPFYARGVCKRILPYNPRFRVDSEGVERQHIERALVHIGKELGVVEPRFKKAVG